MKFLRPSRALSAIATVPLVGMCVCLVLAAAPLFSQVAGWATAMMVAAGAARLHMNRRAAHLPSLPLKVLLFGLSAGGIALTYGSMVGIEPGLTILIVLVSLKVIETNGERDFQVLTLLGYFLCLCTLFFSQDLLLWLYVGVVFMLLTATLVRFHRGVNARGWAAPVWLSARLLVQALPIVAVLFLFFPRTATGFRFQFARSLMGAAGMSDRLAPGSVSSLALSNDIAFRVDFPDGNAPPISQMYWRGAVLWRGDGLTWVAGPRLPTERRGQLAGPAIRQRISLQPHGGRWIFALDRPSGDFTKFEYMPGGFLVGSRLIFNPLHYEVVSNSENRELSLPVEQMRAAVAPALWPSPSPKVLALVESWKRGASTGREIVERALHHFHEEKFIYTLNPGGYGEDGLEDFLFTRRKGFCEHYAAAFATLMRVAGLPSRVVIGYHGGEPNRLGNYVIVRQSDAHAWAEVWLQDTGWVRVDPTEVVAPDRISSGLASFLETRGAEGDASGANDSDTVIGWRDLMRELRLAWDSINYQWDLRVLNFDEENQSVFLATLGFASGNPWPAAAFSAVLVITLALSVIALWLRRPGRRPQDEAGGAWAEFCGALAVAGVERHPSEGPMRFGQRAAAQLAEHRAAILRVADLYTRLRYSAAPPHPHELSDAVREVRVLRRKVNADQPAIRH